MNQSLGINADLTALELVGPRVRLRSIVEGDAAETFREFTAEVTRYMGPQPAEKPEEIHMWIARCRQNMRQGTEVTFAILQGETGEFLGCCALHSREESRIPELGIWLKVAAHGNHFGREAIEVLVQWARENGSFEAFLYPVDRDNIPSRKIPESLGGTVVSERTATNAAGRRLDFLEYHIPF